MAIPHRLLQALLLAALVPASATAHALRGPGDARRPAPRLTFTLEEVAPGVFVVTAQGVPYYVANSVIVVGADGVLLVDSSAGTNEARALREAIRRVTDRPVRYVVDTHFHFDHALGHAAFPEAVTIGHDATRAGLALGVQQPTLARNLEDMPGRIADLEKEAAAEKDEARKAQLRSEASALETYRRQLAALTPSPSSLTFGQSLTLWLGDREVRVLHLGRGHTAGDAVVYLPKERLVCTGDLFNGYIGYMGDAYVDEWADTLGRLAELDFDTVVPGHGKPFRGKEAIPAVQACLRDLWRQAESLERSGLSAAEAARRIDLTAHAGPFPRLAEKGFDPIAVERIYAVIDERARQGRATGPSPGSH
jgi:cyclase